MRRQTGWNDHRHEQGECRSVEKAVGDGGSSLDYVVFGIGFGATLLVLGLLIRDFGARFRFRRPAGPDGVFHAEELVAKVSWSRFCGALGTVWATVGLAFVVITMVCMLFMVSDARAGWVMGVSFLIVVVAMAFWTWAFFDRFGSYGILSERDVVAERVAIERASGPLEKEAPVVAEENDQPRVVALEQASDTSERVESDQTQPDDLVAPETTAPEIDDADTAESPSLPTPEERLAAATSPMDHDSHEADLDTSTRADGRPGRRSFRPYQAASAPATDAVVKTEEAAQPDSDVEKDDDGRSDAKSPVESRPLPESSPREA